ncbi:MAG: hypothetical protein V3R86_05235 [Candidatus Hydrothermarchaeaceae archaeon]
MEFCSSCKGVMVPKDRGKYKVLACRVCGHEIKNFKTGKYQIKENVSHTSKDILIIDEGKRKITKDQRKYLIDLYGNEMYEASEE